MVTMSALLYLGVYKDLIISTIVDGYNVGIALPRRL